MVQKTCLRSVGLEVQKVGFVSKKWLWSQNCHENRQIQIALNGLKSVKRRPIWLNMVRIDHFECFGTDCNQHLTKILTWNLTENLTGNLTGSLTRGIDQKVNECPLGPPIGPDGSKLDIGGPEGSIYPLLRVRPCLGPFWGPNLSKKVEKTDENGRFLVFLRPENGPKLLWNGLKMEQTDWGWTWDALGALKRSKYDPLGPKSGQESGKTGQKRVFFGLSEA